MKKNYLIILPAFIGMCSSCLAIEQKTTYEVATSVFETLSTSGTKDSTTLIDTIKRQSKESEVDEKEVIKILIQKINSKITSYQRDQNQSKNEFLDSKKVMTLSVLWLTFNCLVYYFSQDTADKGEKGHFFGPQDLQEDSKTGGVFISDYVLKSAVQAGRTKSNAFAGIVVSGIALSWGMLLRAKEWYEANCYKKNVALRNELEEYLSTL